MTWNGTPRLWDSDPGPGPLPPRWPSLEQINMDRLHWGLEPIPSSQVLTEILLAHGFTTCEGTPYRRSLEVVDATSEAEVMVG